MSSQDQLNDWVRRVDDFGGRIGDGPGLLEALQRSNLGSSKIIPTAGPTASLKNEVLAEIKLPTPMLVDVTTALPDVSFQGAVDPGVNIGDACWRVTWGTSSGVNMTVDIDANRGWRHSFLASYLRVEFIPRPSTFVFPANTAFQMAGGQGRNLTVQAQVGPSSGGSNTKLTRTYMAGEITGLGGTAGGTIPAFAESVYFSAGQLSVDGYQLLFTDGFVSQVMSSYAVDQAADGYTGIVYKRRVPQQALVWQVTITGDGGTLSAPRMIFELAV